MRQCPTADSESLVSLIDGYLGHEARLALVADLEDHMADVIFSVAADIHGGLCKTLTITINRVDFQNIEKAGDTPRQIIGNGPSVR